MKRIKLVVLALAIMVAAFASVSAPAMADNNLNCRDARGDLIRCDGDLYAPYNQNYYDYHPNYYYNDPDDYYYNRYYNDPYDYYNYYDGGLYSPCFPFCNTSWGNNGRNW